MNAKKSSNPTPSRAAKRARFDEQKSKSGGASPLILVAGIVVLLVLIGGTIFALARPPVAAVESPVSASSPKLETYRAGDQGLLVKAATFGHDPYPLVEADNGTVHFPLSTFDDYHAHYYTYMHAGRPVEFFVLKSKDGVVRAAFNACDVCFDAKKGYTQDGDYMICNNCGRRFPANEINDVHGGCNPSPLAREVDGDTLVIQVEEIVKGLDYF